MTEPLQNIAAEGKLASQPLAATTTEQEDMTKAGQRAINLMWETTQAKIAVWVVLANLVSCSIIAIVIIAFRIEVTTTQLAVLTLCLQPINIIAGIIIGFYFSRTNHTNVGGVGKKEPISEGGSR